MTHQRITEEEAGWIVLARSLSPDLSAAFIAAAEAIAAGRKPEPYVGGPSRPHVVIKNVLLN